MKKIITAIVLLTCLNCTGQNATKTKDGNYIAVAATQSSQPGKATGKTFTDAKGNKFPVYESARGKLYILRISKNTGKEYKQYLKL